jgi:hypothetical protein
VCGHLFTERISDKQKWLSDGGKKDIGKYRATLSNVFKELSKADRHEVKGQPGKGLVY